MKVKIMLVCLEGYLSAKWNKKDEAKEKLIASIQQDALNAWQHRNPSEKIVRFLAKMSDRHFRFLNISEQNGNLIVSRN